MMEADHGMFEMVPLMTESAHTAAERGHTGVLEIGASHCATTLHTSKHVVSTSSGPHSLTSIVHASDTSPTVTKVERTFVHIAETTHMNVMSSSPPQEQEQEQSKSWREHEYDLSAEGQKAPENPPPLTAASDSLKKQTVLQPDDPPLLISVHLEGSGSLEMVDLQNLKEDALHEQLVHRVISTCPARSTSRIPILISQSNAEGPASSREVPLRKGKQTDQAKPSQAHLNVQKRKDPCRRLASRTKSSSCVVSSVDEPRGASLTPSTTRGSEEHPHPLEEKGQRAGRSRIPQPATLLKKDVLPKVATSPLPVTLANSRRAPASSQWVN